ncbi:neurogenic locus notch homolog protein 2-like [Mytilus edulis]|uniref:neurogenic locus notch homolog protein 2-like n=1 Tax=Mytilus edulis TaxID=6550 RepID=UPI0039EF8FF5
MFVLLFHATALLIVTAQKNLTPFGQATQSSKYHASEAEHAIYPPVSNEWGPDQCSHTAVSRTNVSEAWWMFKFSFEIAYVTEIQIYYRERFAYRMNGFKIFITNTSTIPPDGYLCYEDPDTGLPDITQTIPCNYLGKYVIYYDNKGSQPVFKDGPIVELCYVAINGCQKGFWGNNCEIHCADNCINRHCHPGNGSCVWGCNPTNCLNDLCKNDTGVCTDGCKERRTGLYCEKCCPSTHYGPMCNESCPENCHGPCDLKTGNCAFGCSNGWTGNNCAQECLNGTFGRNCSEFCAGCLSSMCDPVNGECDNTVSCSPGYLYSEYCNTRCFQGFWGENCSRTCSPTCIDQHCYPENGSCVLGCNPQNCLNHKCDIYTGTCTDGCVSGLSGQYCNTFSAKTMESDSGLPTQVGLFIGGILLGVLMTVAVSFFVQRKRGKENNAVDTQSHEQQQYDDVQHVQMENVSTYQDLMTPQSSNVYDQIDTTYVNQ